jgi:hypothetical protein
MSKWDKPEYKDFFEREKRSQTELPLYTNPPPMGLVIDPNAPPMGLVIYPTEPEQMELEL